MDFDSTLCCQIPTKIFHQNVGNKTLGSVLRQVHCPWMQFQLANCDRLWISGSSHSSSDSYVFFFARRNSGLWRKFDQLFGCPVTPSCQIWNLRFEAFEGDGPTRWYDALGFLYEQQLSIGRKYWKPKIGPMFHELWMSLRHLYDSTENIWRNYITYCFTNCLWWQWLWQDGMSFWNIGIVCKAEVDSCSPFY